MNALFGQNWKTRQTAYDELNRQIKATIGDDPLFGEYGHWLTKITADANPAALDSGLDAALCFADMAPEV